MLKKLQLLKLFFGFFRVTGLIMPLCLLHHSGLVESIVVKRDAIGAFMVITLKSGCSVVVSSFSVAHAVQVFDARAKEIYSATRTGRFVEESICQKMQ